MATVANLMVNFSTNIASMVTDFEKTSKAVRNSSNEITSTLKLLKAGFEGVIGIEALKMGADWIGQQMEMIEANKKTADSLSISYASLTNMQLVAKESGVQTEALTGSLDKMQKTLYSAAAGSAKQADVFKQLHLSIADLMSLSPDKQFDKIATSISQIANPTERMGIAMAIFGKGAGQMVNIFNDYKEKSADAATFTSKFGLALTDIDAQKVVQAEEAMNKVKMASAGMADTIAVRVSPLIEGMAKDWMNASSGAKAWGEMTDKAIAFIINDLDALELTMKGIKTGWDTITTATVSGATAIYAVVTGQGDLSKNILDQGHQQVSQLGKDYLTAANSVGTFGTAVKRYYADSAAEAAAAAKNHNGSNMLGNMDGMTGAADMNAAITRQKALLKSIVGPALTLQQTQTDLNALYDAGKISALQYSEAMDKLQLEMAKTDHTAAGGFKAGMLEVKTTFSDIGTLASKTVVDGFKNAEDAIVNFAQTGKLSFKTMVDSMVSDLIRLEVRQNITGPLFSAIAGGMSGSGSGGGLLSGLGNLFHFANGGSFQVGGNGGTDSQLVQFMASPNETVTVTNPGQSVSGGSGVVNNITIQAPAGSQASKHVTNNSSGGQDVMIVFDQIMSGILGNSNSLTSRALRTNTGLSPALAQR